jgi:hypothetical protein
MAANFDNQWTFTKTLSQSDFKEGRLYLPSQFVKILGPVDGTERVTVFYDQMKSYTMNLCKRSGRDPRAFLGDGWRDFVKEKDLKKGDIVTLQIIRHEAAAARRAVGRFDLNHSPPPPEGNEGAREFDLNRSPPPPEEYEGAREFDLNRSPPPPEN